MASHVDLVDMNFVRAAQDLARGMGAPESKMDFAALKGRLDEIRRENGFPAAEHSIAVVARDFDNPRQGALSRAVEAVGFDVKEVDYRHTFVSQVQDESRHADRAPVTLSHWLSYMCGIVASNSPRSVVVVSGAFELAGPLTDFATRDSEGRAAVAMFKRLLNKRWIDNGLFDGDLPIEFVNLERNSKELLGVDLRELARRSEAARRDSSLPI